MDRQYSPSAAESLGKTHEASRQDLHTNCPTRPTSLFTSPPFRVTLVNVILPVGPSTPLWPTAKVPTVTTIDKDDQKLFICPAFMFASSIASPALTLSWAASLSLVILLDSVSRYRSARKKQQSRKQYLSLAAIRIEHLDSVPVGCSPLEQRPAAKRQLRKAPATAGTSDAVTIHSYPFASS